ncbi:histidine kinase [Galbitalea sp. SE-J8]|uniref:sensor histidine kinase n=1 Tax=Galbitalea sp. SE-J8 TaxID=3054952 RepID=UPI00259D2D8A|nr:histidine kinase [Galbitalea sp. SE-J8]MDM4764079.1 histidine kinase [Galbitalea sp. SE-J8]
MSLAALEVRSPLRVGLSALGVLAVTVSLVRNIVLHADPWSVVALVPVALWVALTIVRRVPDTVVVVTAAVAAALSGLSSVPTQVLGIVAAIAVVLRVIARSDRPVRDGVAVLGSAVIGIGAGALIVPTDPLAILGSFGAIAIATLSAISRRQFRTADAQSRALLEERARSAASDERARIARDIHDVLAHSLGGLVLQLDAVDAELDAGATDAAHARVRAARSLAADGLTEARAAVRALREPEHAPVDLPAALRRLVEEHRAHGGSAALAISPGIELPPRSAAELALVARELLVNARRHAPGAAVDVELRTDGADVVLRVSNRADPHPTGTHPADPHPTGTHPTGTHPAATHPAGASEGGGSEGGGFGLRGVRERVAGLDGTVRIDDRDPFVVTVRVAR